VKTVQAFLFVWDAYRYKQGAKSLRDGSVYFVFHVILCPGWRVEGGGNLEAFNEDAGQPCPQEHVVSLPIVETQSLTAQAIPQTLDRMTAPPSVMCPHKHRPIAISLYNSAKLSGQAGSVSRYWTLWLLPNRAEQLRASLSVLYAVRNGSPRSRAVLKSMWSVIHISRGRF
jgi:hypothetical protein